MHQPKRKVYIGPCIGITVVLVSGLLYNSWEPPIVAEWHAQFSCEALLCNAGDLLREVRQGFEDSRKFKEPYAMKYSLSNGRVQLKQLKDMLGMRL